MVVEYKQAEIIPVRNKLAVTVEKEFHRQIISKQGTLRTLFTDDGKNITKDVDQLIMKLRNRY